MILQFDEFICQKDSMKSGEMRSGREDKFDAPLTPFKILLDDINKTVVTWKGFTANGGEIVAFRSVFDPVKYKESHHIT